MHEASSRRNWRAGTPGLGAVRLFQGSEESAAGRPQGVTETTHAGRQTREALLQACAGGDRTALQSLYRETAPQLFGLALRILRNRELAEDIVQDSFVLVWRNAHSFDPARGAAMAWLGRIVRNRCIDLLRQRGREAPLDGAAIERWEDPMPGPAELAALSRDAIRLRACLEELAESPRKFLMLAYFEGTTYKEAAARLGVPLGTVKGWVRRSLAQLKGCMER
jgi:RNA polymerase sigma-70 factor, ECF subfamily